MYSVVKQDKMTGCKFGVSFEKWSSGIEKYAESKLIVMLTKNWSENLPFHQLLCLYERLSAVTCPNCLSHFETYSSLLPSQYNVVLKTEPQYVEMLECRRCQALMSAERVDEIVRFANFNGVSVLKDVMRKELGDFPECLWSLSLCYLLDNDKKAKDIYDGSACFDWIMNLLFSK